MESKFGWVDFDEENRQKMLDVNIIVFKPSGTKGKIDRNGSIDYQPIINDVKTIMEGGEEAFVVRAKKYGL